MFYYTNDGWKVFTKKVSFTKTIETYTNNEDEFAGEDNLTVTTNTLTEEQLRRLETIREVQAISIGAVEKYVFEGKAEVELIDLQKEIEAERIREKLKAYVPWDNISTEEMLELMNNFKNYKVGTFYVVGDIFNYENQLYRVVQAHTSQSDWIPTEVPALYTPIAPPEVIAEWVQPKGAHDVYQVGDRVLYKGKIYECIAPNNSWKPDVHGWVLVD